MAWLDENQIREKFSIQKGAYSGQIGAASESAARKVRRWVESAVYTEAIAAAAPGDADELQRYETVVDAHAWLTMYYLAMAAGIKLSPDGFLKAAQSASSPATSQTITNQYLTPNDLAAKKQEFYDTAWDIIKPYAIVETSEIPTSNSYKYPTAVAVTADW